MKKPKTQSGGSLEPVCWALVRLWRANATLATKHREPDSTAAKGLRAYASGLRACADQLESIIEKPNAPAHRPGAMAQD